MGVGGGGNPEVKYGNDNDDEDDEENDKEDVMDMMDVLPPLAAHRIELLKCLNTERERAI